MDRQLISEWFAYVPVLYWPVLCLEIVKFHLWAWVDAETLGYARQMIIAVNDHGRIRVRFIEDAPVTSENWQLRLSELSATASKLTAPSPSDLIEGPISDVLSAHMKLLLRRGRAVRPCPTATNAGPPQPILEPG
ncbi:MAG: hypothetical protein AAFW65_05480 [Pseudomonadota bacterium]